MSFLAPALLFGMILASAPIIIHLLNRRRFIRVEWAPMKYLKLTLKSNRRRLRIEQWLLLAVRTLVVLTLFLAVARPVGSGVSLAAFLAVPSRASRIVVIDDSLSMAYQTAGSAAFAQAQRAAANVVDEIGAQDSLTLLVTSRIDEPLVQEAQLEDTSDLQRTIASLGVSHVASSWTATFDAVDRRLHSAVFPLREVILITDLWSAGWTPEVTDVCNRWADSNVTLRIIDVGLDPAGNRLLVSLTQTDAVALVDTKVNLTARIRNDGAELLRSAQATLTVDDGTQPLTLPDLPSGEAVDVPIAVTFGRPGQHRVSLAIPGDDLPEDNTRYALVDVRRSVDVTLVDGEPGSGPFESETDFLALALTAGNSQWKTTPTITSEWLGQPLIAPDVLVLANVASVPIPRIREIEGLVDAGMGLIVFAGDELDAAEYNDQFYRDGHGLLPARIDEIRDAAATGLVIEPLADSPLAPLTRLSVASLARIRPKRIAAVTAVTDSDQQVRVLARWNDADQSPAVLEKRVGHGRVLFWTVTADRHWSDWPTEPSYVLAMRLATQSAVANTSHRDNILAGQAIRYPLDRELTPASATIQLAGADAAQPVSIDKSDPDAPSLVYLNTRVGGYYEARWEGPGIDARSRLFAVSPDVADSRPDRLTDDRLQQLLGKLKPQTIRYSGDDLSMSTAGRELWRFAVIALVALVATESLLAPWVSRGR